MKLTKSKIVSELVKKLKKLIRYGYDVLLKTKVDNIKKLIDLVEEIIRAYALDKITDEDMVKDICAVMTRVELAKAKEYQYEVDQVVEMLQK